MLDESIIKLDEIQKKLWNDCTNNVFMFKNTDHTLCLEMVHDYSWNFSYLKLGIEHYKIGRTLDFNIAVNRTFAVIKIELIKLIEEINIISPYVIKIQN